MPDRTHVRLERHGPMVLLQPVSPAARRWLDENVEAEPWRWVGDALAVDRPAVEELLAAMLDELEPPTLSQSKP